MLSTQQQKKAPHTLKSILICLLLLSYTPYISFKPLSHQTRGEKQHEKPSCLNTVGQL